MVSSPAQQPMLHVDADAPCAPPPARSDFPTLAPWYLTEFMIALSSNLYIMGSLFFAKTRLGRSNTDCLWITASWGLVYVFFSLLSGKMSDRWGPRALILRATCCCVFSALLGLTIVYFPSFWLVILCLATFNLASTPVWPALESAVTRSPAKASLSKRIAIYNVMWSGGVAVAISSSGLINALSPPFIFLTAAAASFAAFLLIWLFTTAPPSHLRVPVSPAEHAEEAESKTPRARALLHMAWLVNPLAHVAIFVLLAITPQLVANTGVSPAAAGIWAFVRVLGFVILSLWIGWHYRIRYLLAAYVIMAGTFLAMLLFQNAATFLACQIAFGLAAAFLYASSLYYAMHVSSGAGGHAGIHEALLGAGMFAGPFVGALASTTGGGIPLIAASVSAVLVLGLITLCLQARLAGPHQPRVRDTLGGSEP